MKDILDEKKKAYVAGQRNDYVDAYLTERKIRLESNDQTSDFFSGTKIMPGFSLSRKSWKVLKCPGIVQNVLESSGN